MAVGHTQPRRISTPAHMHVPRVHGGLIGPAGVQRAQATAGRGAGGSAGQPREVGAKPHARQPRAHWDPANRPLVLPVAGSLDGLPQAQPYRSHSRWHGSRRLDRVGLVFASTSLVLCALLAWVSRGQVAAGSDAARREAGLREGRLRRELESALAAAVDKEAALGKMQARPVAAVPDAGYTAMTVLSGSAGSTGAGPFLDLLVRSVPVPVRAQA